MSEQSPQAPRHFRPLGRFERIARKLHVETMRRLGVSQFTARAQGARFVVDTRDYIDNCIGLFGMWEEAQLEELARLATERRFDYFLDVGANAGFYSVMFAMKNLAERIIAFEPDPGNYARMMANLNANDLAGRVEAVPLALGDKASEVTLYEGAQWNRGESTIVVPEQTPQEVTFQVRQARFDDQYAIAGKIHHHQDGRRGLRVPRARRHGAHAAGKRLLSAGRALFRPHRRTEGACLRASATVFCTPTTSTIFSPTSRISGRTSRCHVLNCHHRA